MWRVRGGSSTSRISTVEGLNRGGIIEEVKDTEHAQSSSTVPSLQWNCWIRDTFGTSHFVLCREIAQTNGISRLSLVERFVLFQSVLIRGCSQRDPLPESGQLVSVDEAMYVVLVKGVATWAGSTHWYVPPFGAGHVRVAVHLEFNELCEGEEEGVWWHHSVGCGLWEEGCKWSLYF